MRVILSFAIFLSAAMPALAADRGFTVTSFDRIRVEGPYSVSVTSGGPPAVRARGDARGLDRVSVRVDGRTLVVRRDSSWGGYPGETGGPVAIAVSTPGLTAASLAGAGSIRIDRMRGLRVDLVAAGSGGIALARVDADLLTASVAGSGGIGIAGMAADARIVVRGSGSVDAPGLSVADLDVTSDGSGAVTVAARRAARVTANGAGNITVTGDAACTVRATGSGTVACGR